MDHQRFRDEGEDETGFGVVGSVVGPWHTHPQSLVSSSRERARVRTYRECRRTLAHARSHSRLTVESGSVYALVPGSRSGRGVTATGLGPTADEVSQ